MKTYILTSESVTEGHPDKVCDTIADAILDAYLKQDPTTRINIEALAKYDHVFLSGEITSNGQVDHEAVARNAIKNIGYNNPEDAFSADGVRIQQVFTRQASEIDNGVSANKCAYQDQGAGDQGMMFGYATDETETLMPTPIYLAHRITHTLAQQRKNGKVAWLKPDGKAQVSVRYVDNKPVEVTDIVVSCQHAEMHSLEAIKAYVKNELLPVALADWDFSAARLFVNPTGSFIKGGPEVDSGLTGRKIIVDTYGGASRHGGGSFSGKDASKVDRSGAYFCRFVARQLVKKGIAKKAEIQVSYAIGVPQPVSILVDTFGTGCEKSAEAFVKGFDFRPAAIIETLNLLEPIYSLTTNYGHFGKPGLAWEE